MTKNNPHRAQKNNQMTIDFLQVASWKAGLAWIDYVDFLFLWSIGKPNGLFAASKPSLAKIQDDQKND